ncbi:hypothetical protein AFAEC_1181 [Aliarcobacter faecis]|uniref:hypothetical protein n=1 Tax=Aliarcobacter faecis TaxID=1564138 RepID=UPI00047D3791|nr:hypothetical protein [Aliarcobacter faecis]QKF73346.1 hypothetical protein AFAEC_1181 [Aliarcobacter faecis]
MKFEYIGFRPIISQKGISFKQGKDDKYIYLPYAYELLDTVNSDYDVNKSHSYSIKIDKSNIDKLYKELLALNPNLKEDINSKLEEYKKQIEIKHNEIENRKNLSEIEKNIYLNNLKYMKDYRINRAKNKIFYYSAIYNIANLIRNKKIKKLDIPFNEKFWHTLKTLQGVLSAEKVNSNLTTYEKDGNIHLLFTTSL